MPSSYKLWLLPRNLGLLVPGDQQEKTAVIVLAGVIHSNQQNDVRVLAHGETGRNECGDHLDISNPLPYCTCEQSYEATRTVRDMIVKVEIYQG